MAAVERGTVDTKRRKARAQATPTITMEMFRSRRLPFNYGGSIQYGKRLDQGGS